MKGTVKWFNDAKGFGFLTTDDGEDVFVHHTSTVADQPCTLWQGQRVEFDVRTAKKGLCALNVRALAKMSVSSSPSGAHCKNTILATLNRTSAVQPALMASPQAGQKPSFANAPHCGRATQSHIAKTTYGAVREHDLCEDQRDAIRNELQELSRAANRAEREENGRQNNISLR